MDRLFYGVFSIWCLGYLTHTLINLDTYAPDHGKTLVLLWALLSIWGIKKYVKEEREWRKKRKATGH